MYGYTMHIPAPAEAYRTMHQAVLEFDPVGVMTPRPFTADA